MNTGSGGGGPAERLAPEDRAPIAAVDGIGSLSPLDAEAVDPMEAASFEAAAGALFAAFASARGSTLPPPPGLQSRLERAAHVHLPSQLIEETAAVPAGTRTAAQPSSSGLSLLPALAGWAAAAALLIGLVTVVKRTSDLESGVASLQPPATRMMQLQLSAIDTVELSWKPLGNGAEVSGSVIWSDERNEGFMRIKGLAQNNPTASQYQLWIFRGNDPGAEPYPVDGGVFDISASGEVVVPISAKLSVGHAGTFAVTVEEPGGVVVSGRERIVALAGRA